MNNAAKAPQGRGLYENRRASIPITVSRMANWATGVAIQVSRLSAVPASPEAPSILAPMAGPGEGACADVAGANAKPPSIRVKAGVPVARTPSALELRDSEARFIGFAVVAHPERTRANSKDPTCRQALLRNILYPRFGRNRPQLNSRNGG